MTISIIQIAAMLAPLLVALACLMAWRYLDGGRHLLFWALGHALLALAFQLLAFTGVGPGSLAGIVAALCAVTSAVVFASGIRVLIGHNDRMWITLLVGVALTVAVV
ncbi:MAG: hypothetical protein VW600_19345, partial [Ferrovibrio sp.]